MVEEPGPEVIEAALAGDLAAFERLVRAYQVHVWRFLRHLLGDAGEAEDVAQETFIRLYQRLDTFSWRCKFSTWVFQVARNAGIDALRRRERRERLAWRAPGHQPAPAPDARAEVHAAVASLTPKLRETLLLVEVLGLSQREAATVLRVPEGTVKSRLFQARQKLAGWLAAEGSAGAV